MRKYWYVSLQQTILKQIATNKTIFYCDYTKDGKIAISDNASIWIMQKSQWFLSDEMEMFRPVNMDKIINPTPTIELELSYIIPKAGINVRRFVDNKGEPIMFINEQKLNVFLQEGSIKTAFWTDDNKQFLQVFDKDSKELIGVVACLSGGVG